jgi:hypothetical protein
MLAKHPLSVRWAVVLSKSHHHLALGGWASIIRSLVKKPLVTQQLVENNL